MARQFSARGPTRSRNRPNRTWSGFLTTTEIAVPAASKVLLASFVLSVEGIDEVVLRTRGILGVRTDQLAADELQLGAFGMIVVTDTALAAGVASLPGPGTESSDDGWFVWQPINAHFLFNNATGFDPNAEIQYDFDSKAKRIVEGGRSVAVIVENVHATHGFNATLVMRALTQVRGTN